MLLVFTVSCACDCHELKNIKLVNFASKFIEALMNDILLSQGVVRFCSRARAEPTRFIVYSSCSTAEFAV